MDDCLLSVQAFVTKNVCKYHKRMHACVVSHRSGPLFLQLLYVAVAQIVQQPSFTSASFFFVSLGCLMASGRIINLSDLLIAFGVFPPPHKCHASDHHNQRGKHAHCFRAAP